MFIYLFKIKEVYFCLNPGCYIGEISRSKLFLRVINCTWLRFLKFCGVKICLAGASYENIGNRNWRSIVARSKILHFHGIRDSISEALCNDYGIKNIIRGEDLAFGCSYDFTDKISTSGMLISMRHDKSVGVLVFDLLTKIHNTSTQIYLSSQVERDLSTQALIEERFVQLGRVTNLAMVSSIEDALKRYSEVSYVISNRLHVLLLAWFAGATPIALISKSKNQKIRGILNDLGLEKFIIEYDENNIFTNDPCKTFEQSKAPENITSNEQLKLVFDHVFK